MKPAIIILFVLSLLLPSCKSKRDKCASVIGLMRTEARATDAMVKGKASAQPAAEHAKLLEEMQNMPAPEEEPPPEEPKPEEPKTDEKATGDEPGKPGEKKRSIGIDQVRPLAWFCGLTPHTAANKVALLTPADAMTLAAARSRSSSHCPGLQPSTS